MGARAPVAPSNGLSRKILGSHCDQTPPRNMLKLGQNVHLWWLHFLAFMSQPVSVAGFATTRRNVIFTDGELGRPLPRPTGCRGKFSGRIVTKPLHGIPM